MSKVRPSLSDAIAVLALVVAVYSVVTATAANHRADRRDAARDAKHLLIGLRYDEPGSCFRDGKLTVSIVNGSLRPVTVTGLMFWDDPAAAHVGFTPEPVAFGDDGSGKGKTLDDVLPARLEDGERLALTFSFADLLLLRPNPVRSVAVTDAEGHVERRALQTAAQLRELLAPDRCSGGGSTRGQSVEFGPG